nr:MAG: hypothetical protein [Bacteriophage sp.]
MDTTDSDIGPFATYDEAFREMLKYLKTTEAEYHHNLLAQELVYICQEE